MITAFLLTTFLFAAAVMIWGLMNAPEGEQDEHGFHMVWRNNSAAARNVCCIWVDQIGTLDGQCAAQMG